jgi:hypothetical protein
MLIGRGDQDSPWRVSYRPKLSALTVLSSRFNLAADVLRVLGLAIGRL